MIKDLLKLQAQITNLKSKISLNQHVNSQLSEDINEHEDAIAEAKMRLEANVENIQRDMDSLLVLENKFNEMNEIINRS